MSLRNTVLTALLLALALPVAAQVDLAANRRGVLVNVHAYLASSGRTLVPLRAVGTWLGADVGFRDKTVTLTKGDTTITLPLNSKRATVRRNGTTRTVTLEEPARALEGITVVPIRFVAEALGASVAYRPDELYPGPAVELRDGGRRVYMMAQGVPPAEAARICRVLGTGGGAYYSIARPYKGYTLVKGEYDRGDEFRPTQDLIHKTDGEWQDPGIRLQWTMPPPDEDTPRDVLRHFGLAE